MGYRVGFVGTGADPDDPDTDGYAMAYRHAAAYQRLSNCEIVACADVVRQNAESFAEAHGIDPANVFEDHESMLRTLNLDVVSVCTPPSVHAELVIDIARFGDVRAIHCEKPMADTWGDCKRMTRICDEEGVQLTINHQKRFGQPFRKAKGLIDEGRIGDVTRFEFGDTTLYDMGSHLFDMCNYFNDGAEVEWVIAQIEYSEPNMMFGTHNENQAVSQWRYENGVFGLASTGWGDEFLDCFLRVTGTEGAIEIGADDATLRVREDGGGWRSVDTGHDFIHDAYPHAVNRGIQRMARVFSGRLAERLDVPGYIDRAIEDVLDCLDSEVEPELSARTALSSQEVIFASWESARRRGRVELPLDIEDNPLQSMVESGEIELH